MVTAAGVAQSRHASDAPETIAWQSFCDDGELAEATNLVADPGAALRTRSPEQAMQRVEPYLADYGVTRVAHLTHLDRVGIPVHTAHKPAGKSLSNGSGKGVTPEASRIGAMMEAIEQTYWEDSPIPRLLASSAQLDADGIARVDPEDIPMNRGNFLNRDLVIEWTPMTDIRDGSQIMAPADSVGLPWGTHSKRTALTHMCSSNGLASGSNVVEAMISGLTEVMERDAVAMNVARTGVHFPNQSLDLDQLEAQLGDPFASLREKIERAELRVSVFDATEEVGLPTYKSNLTDPTPGGAGSFSGYGANLDANTAIVRAVTEAVQARCLIIAGARDDQFRCGRDASRLSSRHHQFYEPPATGTPVAREDLSTGSLVGDVEALIAMLADSGMPQVLLHRYTQPTDPVQVVRILVPRLEGYKFANYQPGPRARAAIAACKAGQR